MAKRGHQAAVQDGALKHFSPSQLKDFRRCKRLWSFLKLFGQRPAPKKAQTRGTSLHKQPEDWYKFGTEPTHEAFLAARAGLPEPHQDLLVEYELVDPTLYVEDVRLEGHSDLIVPPHCSRRGIPEVWDWKFVSSFGYMEDPANDLQCLIYGYWASRRWPEAREIGLNLVYLRAEGSSDFKPRRKVVPVERCEAEWQDIVVPTVLAMKVLAASAPGAFSAVEPSFENDNEACRKYGGCAFLVQCGVDLRAGNKSDKVSAAARRRVLADFDSGLRGAGND